MPGKQQLAHRASVKRAVVSRVQGSPESSWGVIATSLRCLLVVDSFSGDETQTLNDVAKLRATLYTAPGADIKPGDIVVMRGRMAGKYRVTAQGQTVPDRHGFQSHEEWKVDQV